MLLETYIDCSRNGCQTNTLIYLSLVIIYNQFWVHFVGIINNLYAKFLRMQSLEEYFGNLAKMKDKDWSDNRGYFTNKTTLKLWKNTRKYVIIGSNQSENYNLLTFMKK